MELEKKIFCFLVKNKLICVKDYGFFVNLDDDDDDDSSNRW